MRRGFTVTRLLGGRNRLSVLCTLLCVAFLLATAPAGFAEDDDESYDLLIFGDSLSDTANAAVLGAGINFRPFDSLVPSGPYFTLRFTNGRTWVERLAKQIGKPETAKAVFLFPGKRRATPLGARERDWFLGALTCRSRRTEFSCVELAEAWRDARHNWSRF